MNNNVSLGPGSYTDPLMTKVQSAVFKEPPPFLSSNVRFDTQVIMGGPGPQAYKNPLSVTLNTKLVRGKNQGKKKDGSLGKLYDKPIEIFREVEGNPARTWFL